MTEQIRKIEEKHARHQYICEVHDTRRSIPRLPQVRSVAIAAVSVMILQASLSAQSQWSNGSGGEIYYNGGNVGIGTVSPETLLNLVSPVTNEALRITRYVGSNNWPNQMRFYQARGTMVAPAASSNGDPLVQLDFGGYDGSTFVGSASIMAFANGTIAPGSIPTDLTFTTGTQTGGSERVRITSSGNVGIGTTNPQHLLHVAGTIGAEQVIVSSTGADYVFDPKYRLAPLSEVAAYVKRNHHLPGIASAKEIENKGVNIGDMQIKVLSKVEELTLHMIQLEKQNRKLQLQVQRLQGQISRTSQGANRP